MSIKFLCTVLIFFHCLLDQQEKKSEQQRLQNVICVWRLLSATHIFTPHKQHFILYIFATTHPLISIVLTEVIRTNYGSKQKSSKYHVRQCVSSSRKECQWLLSAIQKWVSPKRHPTCTQWFHSSSRFFPEIMPPTDQLDKKLNQFN